MEILENTPTRLVMEWRPWWQSLRAFGVALLMSALVAFVFILEPGTFAFVHAVFVGLACLFWCLFLFQTQRTLAVLDREKNTLRVCRKSLFGGNGYTIELSAIDAVDVVRGFASPRKPRSFVLIITRNPQTGAKKNRFLAPGYFPHELSATAAYSIRQWLDSPPARS